MLNLTGDTTKYQTKKSLENKMTPWLFLMPFLLAYTIFFAIPAIYSLVLSFSTYSGYGPVKWVGFENYAKLLQYPTFWLVIGNTLFYLLTLVIPVIAVSFGLAVLINSAVIKHKSFFKAGFFLPQITASVAAILVWRVMLGTNTGVINVLLGTKIPFLDDFQLMKWSIVVVVAWRAIGWFMVIFLSGLTAIPEDVIEAATIDGANTLKKLFYITIPLMKPTFLFAFFTCSVTTFKIYNEPNLLVGSGQVAPFDVAPIMNLVTTNIANGNFGMASATGWLMFLMIFILSMFQFKLLKEDGD